MHIFNSFYACTLFLLYIYYQCVYWPLSLFFYEQVISFDISSTSVKLVLVCCFLPLRRLAQVCFLPVRLMVLAYSYQCAYQFPYIFGIVLAAVARRYQCQSLWDPIMLTFQASFSPFLELMLWDLIKPTLQASLSPFLELILRAIDLSPKRLLLFFLCLFM